MSIADFDPEILQDFLTESGELLEQLEGDLIELEQSPDDGPLVNQVFRALHTIKGSASFLQLTNLVEIAHAAETALNEVRGGNARIDEDLMSQLLRAVDVLKVQFEQLSSGQTELEKADQALVDQLVAVGSADANTGGAGDSAAGPSELAEGERPLQLGDGKADLLEMFVEDLDQQLTKLSETISDLADDERRPAAVEGVAQLGEDLNATIDFFECEAMLDLAQTATGAALAASSASEDALEQLLPRLRAINSLLTQQTKGLRRGVLIEPPTRTLVERTAAIGAGTIEDDWLLNAGAMEQEVLLKDGVITDAGDTEAPGTPVDDSFDAADDAPAIEAEPPAAAPVEDATPDAPAAPPQQADSSKQDKAASNAPEQTIRVEVGRLEKLMNLVGELVLQKNRITALSDDVRRVEAIDGDLSENIELASSTLDRVTGEIQVAVMRTRMQPLDKLFGKYPRLIRDLAKKTGKKINLKIEGGETEVDKSVLEELGDPLVHLMRNSSDHGLEPPEERVASGKDETGTITLRASHEGNHVRILVIDDGRGLNRERIAAKAIENGLVNEADVTNLPDEEVHKFIFLPGFSTAGEVSDLSGRGVGMDVVRTNIENLKGTITVSSEELKGTVFEINIPLTIAIMPAMMVRIGDEKFAIPLGSILEIVRPEPRQLSTIVEGSVIRLRDRVMPIVKGADVMNVQQGTDEEARIAVVLHGNEKHVALMVTEVLGQQEIVIKPLDGVEHSGPVSGATVRNDGGVSLIVDVSELIRRSE
ncbi:MAG: chemotaxis protein CheA [Planctomycetota bacterium]